MIHHEYHSLEVYDHRGTGETPRWHILITNVVPKLPSGQVGSLGLRSSRNLLIQTQGREYMLLHDRRGQGRGKSYLVVSDSLKSCCDLWDRALPDHATLQ